MSVQTLETFFLIKTQIGDKIEWHGPYLQLDYATLMVVDFIPLIASIKAAAIEDKTKNYVYKAEVHECILDSKGEWESISIPLTENKCTKIRF